VRGEAAPAMFPVSVVLEANNRQVTVQVDGSVHLLSPDKSSPWAHLRLAQPDPTQREYQIDGSDVTSRKDRDPDEIRAFERSPLYGVAAWLRDEGSYSRWDQVRLVDLADGRIVAEGRPA